SIISTPDGIRRVRKGSPRWRSVPAGRRPGTDRISRAASSPTIPGVSPTSIGRPASTALMTSSATDPMGRKVEPVRRPTSSAGRAERLAAQAGFTLLEIVCVVAIIALLAAVILPALPRGTSFARLEAYAIETATLLKQDRYAAMRRRARVATEISATARTFRSGVTGRAVQLPNDIAVEALLARPCAERAG